MTSDDRCPTRRIKEARFLQRTHPELLPEPEPAEGFDSVLEGNDPFLRYQLREVLGPGRLPMPRLPRPDELLRGRIGTVVLSVSDGRGHRASAPPEFPSELEEYLRRAAPTLGRYLRPYGVERIETEGPIRTLDVSVPGARFNDDRLRGWVDAWRDRGAISPTLGGLLVVAPAGSVHTDADPARGGFGYHAHTGRLPYAFVGLRGATNVGEVRDGSLELALSHVLAEMVLDPVSELAIPELCDSSGPWDAVGNRFDADGGWHSGAPAGASSPPVAFVVTGVRRPSDALRSDLSPGALSYPPG